MRSDQLWLSCIIGMITDGWLTVLSLCIMRIRHRGPNPLSIWSVRRISEHTFYSDRSHLFLYLRVRDVHEMPIGQGTWLPQPYVKYRAISKS